MGEVFSLAGQLEVNLEVNGKKEKVIVTPTSRLTEELRAGVKENRDELMRSLLVKRAIEYIWSCQIRYGMEATSQSRIWSAIPHEHLANREFQDFREELRKWTHRVEQAIKKDSFKTESEVFAAFKEGRDRRGIA